MNHQFLVLVWFIPPNSQWLCHCNWLYGAESSLTINIVRSNDISNTKKKGEESYNQYRPKRREEGRRNSYVVSQSWLNVLLIFNVPGKHLGASIFLQNLETYKSKIETLNNEKASKTIWIIFTFDVAIGLEWRHENVKEPQEDEETAGSYFVTAGTAQLPANQFGTPQHHHKQGNHGRTAKEHHREAQTIPKENVVA